MLGLPNTTAEGRCAALDVRPLRRRVSVIINQDDGPKRQSICGACQFSIRGVRAGPGISRAAVSGTSHSDRCLLSLFPVARLDPGDRQTTGQ